MMGAKSETILTIRYVTTTEAMNPTYIAVSVRVVHLPLVTLLSAKNQAGEVSMRSVPI